MDFNFDTGTISDILELDPGSSALTILGNGGLIVPSGTTAQRPANANAIRFNTDTGLFEGLNVSTWVPFQGSNTNLTGISNLSGTGIITQTGAGTYAQLTITGTAGNITVVNGNGVAGNPTINLATAGTAGTYVSVTTDAFGRVTSGSTTQAWSTITGAPTTLAGFGVTDAVTNAGNVVSFQAGTFASRPTAGTAGRFYFSTDTNAIYYDNGTAWLLNEAAVTGDVSIAAGTGTSTLATVNSNVGTFGSTTVVPVITVNDKGLVTAVSTATISGAISVTGGDLTLSGNTGSTITNATLSTVNGSVGTYGDASHVATFTVNAKGLTTAAANVLITPAAIGAVATSELGASSGVATLDASGYLTTSQIPPAIVGGMNYQGTWNATTNTPTLVSGTGTKGYYYKVNVAGATTIDGNNNWTVGDLIVYNGTTWDGIDGLTTEVTSVFGRVGAVTATLASTDFVNQGTTTTVLHGNANGAPSWGAINLSSDVTGTLPSGSFPALTGDVTTISGGVATTLATVNATTGMFGDATHVAQITVNNKGLVTSVANVVIPNTVALTGDGTASVTTGSSGALTLATVNSNVGTFGTTTAIPVVTVNAKGLVTAMSTVAISGAISITGDATGSGTTGGNTAVTLATVNSNVGQFGNSTNVPQFTVNAKGLITAVSNVAITASGTGAVANAGNVPSIASGTLAARPAASTVGALYVTTDTNMIFRDNGTAWVQVSESVLLFTENAVSPVASTVSGNNAVSIGSGNTASATNSLATGAGASTAVYGAEVRANGSFATAGDAQTGKYVLRNITNNATQTEVFLDGSSARIVLPNNSAMTYSALIVGRRTDATGSEGAWKIEGLVSRDATAATTSLVGSRSKTVLTRPAGWDAEVSADVTNGALAFKVTGQAGNTVRWVVTVTTSEVTN